jgi:TolA-binding protein
LVAVFRAANTTSKIAQLANRYPCAGITADFQDSIAFNAAFDSYLDSNYQQAVVRFKEYLVAHPNGLQKDRANFLIAESYFQMNDIAQAYPYYLKVISGNVAMYHEISLIRAANYEYENQNYAGAIDNYSRLSQIAVNPSRKYGAELGLMRCHFLLENWTASLQSAEFVKNSSLAQTTERTEAYFCKGIAYRRTEKLDDALPELAYVVKNATNQLAAQAKFTIAEINFIKGNYAASESHIRELMKMKPSYDYWTAKALILQTRNFLAKGDLLNAENVINSVINNYAIPNDGVLDEALEVAQEVEAEKNRPRDLEERNNNFIEIND